MLSRAARLTATAASQVTTAARNPRTALAVAGAAAALAGTGAGLAATTTSSTAHAAATSSSHGASSRGAVTRTSPAHDPARPAATTRAAARPDTRAARAAGPARPYLMYDSTTPARIPAHHLVATYANGNFAVPARQVTGRQVLWIDTNGTDPRAAALDVEPGDATPATAANWARTKLTEQPNSLAHIYTMLSEWPAVKTDVARLPQHIQNHVRYWIADPTGTPHLVPGSQATQWYWGTNYDISTVAPTFQ
jgi:hypothetical protein